MKKVYFALLMFQTLVSSCPFFEIQPAIKAEVFDALKWNT